MELNKNDQSLAPRCNHCKNKRIRAQGSACLNGASGNLREYEDGSLELACYNLKTKRWAIHCYPPPLRK